jgi:anti-anti-sigma regulatory factor
LPDLDFPQSRAPASPSAAAAKPAKRDAAAEMKEFEDEWTDSAVMDINVDHGADSIQADIENVAVLFANNQDAVVRPMLESLLPAYPGIEGIRLWNMLFDFLQLTGDRAAFDKLASEFVQACETSPPAWREPAAKSAAPKSNVAESTLQGVLTGDNLAALAPLAEALKAKRPLRVDCGSLLGCDDEAAGRLAELLVAARRQGVAIVLGEAESLISRLRGRLVAGEAQNARSWVLLLELLQRHGNQEEFEMAAIDFAVTFERSPPSWEEKPAPALPPVTPGQQGTRDDAFYLEGDIRNSHFDEIAGVLNSGEHVILDFSRVRRLDFYSAGQLVNRLSPLVGSGRDIVIRSPNHLVAELMAVIGINKLARIIVPKS